MDQGYTIQQLNDSQIIPNEEVGVFNDLEAALK